MMQSNARSRIILAAVLSAPAALMMSAGTAHAQGAARAAAADETPLPIRTIILYRSGVGYFERHGSVTGNQRASISFDAAQVNDILKSLVLLDLDGGKVNAVTYESKEPLERRLRSFGIDISRAPGIADIFQQMRGSRVSVRGPEGDVEGTILGIESRPVALRPDPKEGHINQVFVNLVTSGGVKSIMVPAISSFRFTDEKLNDELNKALAALAEKRAESRKSVELSFSGDGGAPRRVVAAYIQEMPVWKTSYRLLLPEEPGGAKPDPARRSTLTMQGWAIVENTTDDDWRDVRLSLASGRPVSFTMDLYEPFFMARPMIPVPGALAVRPREFESARMLSKAPIAGGRDGAAADAAAMTMSQHNWTTSEGAAMERAAPSDLSPDDLQRYSAGSQASASEQGEQFLYTLDQPVTLERQRSAMLPILSAPVEGRRVSIFNAGEMPKHPMRGVQFTNKSGLHLMPGPVSVFDGSTYAGDATIPHTSRNQSRLLAYALDIDVHARTDSDQTEEVTSLKIVDGMIEQSLRARHTTVYSFDNLDSTRGRVILVEYPRMHGWDLVEPKESAETTDSLHRFETAFGPSESGTLRIVHEQTRAERLGIIDYDIGTLLAYARNGKASQAVIDAVRKAASINSRVLEQQRQIALLDGQRREITEEQSRIRSNMNSVDRNSDLYRRYVTKLNEQETQVEEIGSKREAAAAAKTAAEKELREFLIKLNVQ